MNAKIAVKDRKEAQQIRRGLDDKAVRAFVKIVGALDMLSSDRARLRVLRFVQDAQEEQRVGVREDR